MTAFMLRIHIFLGPIRCEWNFLNEPLVSEDGSKEKTSKTINVKATKYKKSSHT